ncbi:hypothetical protein FRC09_019944, partial [Ceratobasidium sp. 395]
MILSIPEIATTICSFGSIADCARLSRTSRSLFKVASPFVWAYVNDAERLLVLLEPAAFQKLEFVNNIRTVKLVLEEDGATNQYFSRFDVYSPYIKALDIYGRDTGRPRCQVKGWTILLSRARQGLLLPNLRYLRLEPPREPPVDFLMWIVAFASPSLTELTFEVDPQIYPPPHMSYNAASLVIRSIMQHNPSIQRLDL